MPLSIGKHHRSEVLELSKMNLALLLTSLLLYGITAEIVIKDNGYSGLMIAIHEDTPENPDLLKSIKNMITKASHGLHQFTNQRAYFKNVTIVIPSSWTPSSDYKPLPKFDYLNMADVRIAPPHPRYGNIPYTMQLGQCGDRGQFIHMTPEFLLESKNNRPQHTRNGKIFLHEWHHFRYGVFDEYGEQGNSKYSVFYKDENDTIRVNGCAVGIKGWIRRSDGRSQCTRDVNGNVVPDCTFYPDRSNATNVSGKASPMYWPQVDSADEYCDDTTQGLPHNPSAPNMQNDMCNTHSVAAVVNSNEDFKNNKPKYRSKRDLNPEIRINQISLKFTPKFVLVLDVSGSMNEEGRLTALQGATRRLIRYHIKDACNIKLGMVSFASSSSVLSTLTPVNNSTRDELIRKIPKLAVGGTSIGSGIREAIQILQQSGESTERATLIVLSDGEENESPKVNEIMEEMKRSGVVVYTLAIGSKASSQLEELSKTTGGQTDVFKSANEEKSLDAILSTIILESGCTDATILMNKGKLVPHGQDINGTFDVDNNVRSTTVFMTYDPSKVSGKHPTAKVINPDGLVFNLQATECITDENLGSIQFTFPQTKAGEWSYQIENLGSTDVHVNVMINSDLTADAKSQNKNNHIRVDKWIDSNNITHSNLPKIFAKVTRGDKAVIRAIVKAVVYRPGGASETITLNDGGIGADRIPHDGVYTEYFTRLNSDGRYQADIIVVSTNRTKLRNITQTQTSQRAPVMPVLPEEIENEEPRAEFLISELPKVNEVFPSSAIYTWAKYEEPDFESMEEVERFERYTPAGTFVVHDYSAADRIPPSRITDLTVLATNFTERTVQLEWTSAGDDMMDGQAETIQLHYHYHSVFLVRSFEKSFSELEFVDGTLNPLPAYEKHSVVVQLPPEETFSIPNTSRSIYFAVRAVDEAGNIGDVSSSVIVNFPLLLEPEMYVDENQTQTTLYMIVGIAAGSCIAILIVIGVLVKLCSKDKKRQGDVDHERNMEVTYNAK